MPHTVTYNPAMRAVATAVEGDVTIEVLREIFTAQSELCQQHACNLMLNDYRLARLRLSTLDIYELPRIITEIAAQHGNVARAVRRALVITRDTADYHFYETVVTNDFQTERVFFDIDEAAQWLCAS